MNKPIYYITDNANWVIKEIGLSLSNVLKHKNFKVVKSATFRPYGIKHYSTRYSAKRLIIKSPFVNNILTYFHGDDSQVEILHNIRNNQKNIDIIHTSCAITKEHLIRNGIQSEKIVIIPIGIDVASFSPLSEEKKVGIRLKHHIPKDAFVIGSFQKDGNGWGEGLDPKLCKGPDLFCDVVEKIHKQRNVFVYLTGPSRGYVKKRLDDASIPYGHTMIENYSEINEFFNLLNLYLVTSRLEGGPRAPLECMASGVPIISTRVGQTPEVINHGENGFLADIEDVENLTNYSLKLMHDQVLQKKFISNGLTDVKKYDYQIIADQYLSQLYKPLM